MARRALRGLGRKIAHRQPGCGQRVVARDRADGLDGDGAIGTPAAEVPGDQLAEIAIEHRAPAGEAAPVVAAERLDVEWPRHRVAAISPSWRAIARSMASMSGGGSRMTAVIQN